MVVWTSSDPTIVEDRDPEKRWRGVRGRERPPGPEPERTETLLYDHFCMSYSEGQPLCIERRRGTGIARSMVPGTICMDGSSEEDSEHDDDLGAPSR